MGKKLLIVESPAKANTIKKYLGKDFTVLASYGHMRDLIPKTGAVDPEHNFKMQYDILEKSIKHINAIAKELKNTEALYLATDPDREGEAISWHIYELMKQKKALKDKPVYRVVFHEITKSAIQEAMQHPRDISMDLVDSQQARRALDYLVGFTLSPLLWKKVRRGLSAGRVQSPALRLIVEREEQIEQFKPKEYWSISAEAETLQQKLLAKLIIYKGKKLTQFAINNTKQAKSVEQDLLKLAAGKLKVLKVEKKKRKRNPAPPFITSTMQQEAARKLGFTAKKTMRIAQQLYEGIELDEGRIGLITYMRTDSTNLAKEAVANIRETIVKLYGKANLPEKPCIYKTKSKSAQEAHEAIRPTYANYVPDNIAKFLNNDQLKLYTLIWQRSIACQMIPAQIDMVSIDLGCGINTNDKNIFRATGSTITNPGFMHVYKEGTDEGNKKAKDNDDENSNLLPPLKIDDILNLIAIHTEQHFTEPPPRYSEASLIKTLEEHGIGRPSTYAAIVDTLLTREYVTLDKKRFKPTDIGRVVNKFLTTYFTTYVDYDFTAQLEDKLDAIARGEANYLKLLKEFWQPFNDLIAKITETVKRKDIMQEELKEKCPKCDKPLVARVGRRGKFIGCSGFPECTYTANIEESGESTATEPEFIPDRECPKCHAKLQIKWGRYGKFIGCSSYPDCKYIEPLEKPTDTGVTCPECKKGSMLKRKSRRGKYFYSCSLYPKCKYATWYEPVAEACPKCKWPILVRKETKKHGIEKICPQKDCDYKETAD